MFLSFGNFSCKVDEVSYKAIVKSKWDNECQGPST